MSNKKNKKQNIELDLFSEDEKFNVPNEFEQQSIDEIFETKTKIEFPLFFKNKDETQFTWYKDEETFEQICVNKENESFRGSLLFGYNEQIFFLKGDITLLFDVISRNQIKITQNEYDKKFEQIILGREEFLTNNETYKYIQKQPLTNNIAKHKWKPL